MDHLALNSKDIAIVGYEPGTQILEVAFRSGGVYRYEGVPEEIYQGFLGASSHGAYFQENIRGRYSHQKVS